MARPLHGDKATWPEGGHQELEVKLLATPALLALVREDPMIQDFAVRPPVTLALVNTYYDTPTRWFAAHHLALRIRSDGQRHILGLKSRDEAQQGLFRRWEVERSVPSPHPDMAMVTAILADGFALETPADIAPLFETRFTRIEFALDVPGRPGEDPGRVAVAFDEGAIVAGHHSEAIAEIELELLSGPEAVLTGMAARLMETYSLGYGRASKAQRGYRLADAGRAPAAAGPAQKATAAACRP